MHVPSIHAEIMVDALMMNLVVLPAYVGRSKKDQNVKDKV